MYLSMHIFYSKVSYILHEQNEHTIVTHCTQASSSSREINVLIYRLSVAIQLKCLYLFSVYLMLITTFPQRLYITFPSEKSRPETWPGKFVSKVTPVWQLDCLCSTLVAKCNVWHINPVSEQLAHHREC